MSKEQTDDQIELPSPEDLQPAIPSTIGKYRVDGLIGRGAVGVVYKGYDEQIGRPLAIKTLRLDVIANLDNREIVLKRFATEARSAGRCLHPNIVTVFDYVEQDGAPYIIMEYVSAGTLESVIRSGTMLPLRQVGEIMAQLLFALDLAHSKGVVHRDVKPANILCPSAASIKVTDFGVARLDALEVTIPGGVGTIGTPNYMSPEQFLGRPVDGRSDLFSAGVILFELLTGTKPFVATDVPELMRMLLNQCPPALSTLRPGLWPHLDDVVQRALARNPEDRFQNAEQFVDGLNVAIEAVAADNSPPLDLTKISPAPGTEESRSTEDHLNHTMFEKLMPETLGAVEQALARSIGPIAKLVVWRVSKKVTDVESMLSSLAEHIANEDEAACFRDEAELKLRNDRGVTGIRLDAVISNDEIHAVTKALVPLIGPVARVIAERQAEIAIGRDDYYQRLAEAIPNEGDRNAFLELLRTKA